MKHVGRLKNNQRRLVVAYRVIPGDPDNCLVMFTDNLGAAYHDDLMKLVESNAGQTAYELAEAMARGRINDGRVMLHAFHKEGKLNSVPTNLVEMVPNTQTTIGLDELNKMIAEQRGVTIAELALGGGPNGEVVKPEQIVAETINLNDAAEMYVNNTVPPVAPSVTPVTESQLEVVEDFDTSDLKPLTDADLAGQYRSQADAMFKEAKRLRTRATELSEATGTE